MGRIGQSQRVGWGGGTVGVRGILCVRTGGAGGIGPPHLFEIGAIHISRGKPCVNLKKIK